MDGKDSVFKKEAADGPVSNQGRLRTIFCDGGVGESQLKTPAQERATEECRYPQTPRGIGDEEWTRGIGLN